MRFVENLKHPDSRSKIIAVLATLIDGLECPDSMVHVPHFGRWCRVKLRQSIDTIVEQQLREIFLFLLLLHIRGDPRCWRGCTRRRRGGSTIQVGEGRQPLQTGHHLTPPRIRRWRGKKAERGGQRSTGGCLSLVGGCSLVAASPRSCATMTATTTRSWWRGWFSFRWR